MVWAAIGAAMWVLVATGAWPSKTGAWPMTAGACKIGACRAGASRGAGSGGASRAGAAAGRRGAAGAKIALALAPEMATRTVRATM